MHLQGVHYQHHEGLGISTSFNKKPGCFVKQSFIRILINSEKESYDDVVILSNKAIESRDLIKKGLHDRQPKVNDIFTLEDLDSAILGRPIPVPDSVRLTTSANKIPETVCISSGTNTILLFPAFDVSAY